MPKRIKSTKQTVKANHTARTLRCSNWYLVEGSMFTIFSFCFFLKLKTELLGHQLTYFDQTTSQWLFAFRSDWLTTVMVGITNYGSTFVIISITLLVTFFGCLYRRFLAEFIVLNLCVSGALGISESLKATFQRSRPPLPWLDSASGYSFPSGHTLLTLSLYGFLAYLALRQEHFNWYNSMAGAGLILLAFMVGISRVYLGVHFPSDVLAGWALAAAWLGICIIGREILCKYGLDLKDG